MTRIQIQQGESSCEHKDFKFLPCSAADRFPGVWACPACGASWNFDPSGRTSVRYLDRPSLKATKTIELNRSKY